MSLCSGVPASSLHRISHRIRTFNKHLLDVFIKHFNTGSNYLGSLIILETERRDLAEM